MVSSMACTLQRTVREFDGGVRHSPISIVRKQVGPSIHVEGPGRVTVG